MQTARVSAGIPLPNQASVLLDAAEPVQDAHALVLGTPGLASLDILCGLIGRGCAAAAELSPDGPVPAEPAEIVLVPAVSSLDMATRAIMLTRRCLLPCGRIVLQDASGALATAIIRLLRAAGFVRIVASADSAVICADWPMFSHQLHGAGRA